MAQFGVVTPKELFVTHIKGEGILLKFWGLVPKSVEIVKNYEYNFQSNAHELERTAGFMCYDQTPIGFKCAVRSKVKQQWCRGIVLNHIAYSELLVQLMDYGAMEQVSVADVRRLDDSFFRYQAQAKECILADVVPSTGQQWTMEAVKFCEEELLYNTMSCIRISEYLSIPVVRIAKKGESEPFVQRLINSGLALIKPEIVPSNYTRNSLSHSASHLVKISCFESQHKFYVQLAAAELELNNLMEEIMQFAMVPENLILLHSPQVNLPCLVLSKQHKYCRALITSVSHGCCAVFYVDYGLKEVKEFQELRALPNRFLKLHTQAISCSLPKEIMINSGEFLRIISKYPCLECQVIGHNTEGYIVQLKAEGQDIFLPPRLPNYSKPLPVSYNHSKLLPGKGYEATISYIHDVSEFYCQMHQNKEELDKISGLLNLGSELRPISLQDCVLGLPVVVKFSEDNAWYRAQIVKINHENDIEVFFVDYGNYDNATLSDVRRMAIELLQFPVQAYKCHLANIEPPTETSMRDNMFELLEEFSAGQVLLLEVKDISKTDLNYSVILREKSGLASINDKMENKFLSLATIPLSDFEELFVTSFTSLDSFFGHLVKLKDDKLEEMQEDINKFYANSCNTKYVPQIDDKVCAKYNLDQQYYRARVESVSSRKCNVIFIDYGNRDEVSLEDVHKMDKKFFSYPQFGIECALSNFPSATPIDKVRSLMLENSIHVRLLQESNKKWLVSLTEDFASNAPLLEILRQHENTVPRSIHGAGLQGFQDRLERQPSYSSSKDNLRHLPISNNLTIGDVKSDSSHVENKSQKDIVKDYTVINIPPKACRNVYVSHVISPSEFYCQIEEESAKLNELMLEIEKVYSTLTDKELNLESLKIGSPCCAYFQEDGGWYRGYIKQKSSYNCQVYYVDYGNTDSVPHSKIKILNSRFFRLPSQALKCKLNNAVPQNGEWSQKAIQDFSNQTLDKSFVAQFVELDNSGLYVVNLVSLNKLQDEILNKEFINLGQGQLQDKSKMLDLNSHATSINLTFTSPQIKVGSFESVIIYYGLNPQIIYCHLKSCESEFKEMMEKIQQYYKNLTSNEALVDRLHNGMICIAQFSQDSVWYRAQVIKMDKNSVSVLYVDYGNTEEVNKNKIRCITQDFTSLPVQSVKCLIKGISPPGKSWPEKNISKYFEGEAQAEFVSKENDCYSINLMINKKNVAYEFIKDGLAIGDSSIQKQVSQQNDFQSVSRPSNIESFPKRRDFLSGQLLSVTVSFTESPFKFWCQSLDENEMLDQLMADIQAHTEIGISPVNTDVLSAEYYCIAKYSEDGAWYRAQIKSCISENEWKVCFIDYGNIEVVSINEISELPPKLKKIHHLCFECQLLGATADLTKDKLDKFQNIVDEFGQDMTAKIEKVVGDVNILSLLYETDDIETNVSEVLFGNESTSNELIKEVKFLSSDVPLGSQEGYVTIVNSPHDFYIQLSGCEDSLASLATELSDKCEANSTDLSFLQNPVIGTACAAKYSEDNNWYRAEIIDIQGTSADVLFVDYGNTSNVAVDTLKVLEENLLSVPPYAIKCKLNGIIPSGEQWSESAINTFQDMVNESLLGITFICKDIPAIVNVSKDDKDIGQTLIDMELANVDTCAETNEAYADDHLSAPIEDQLHSLPFDQSYPKRKLSSTKLPVKICYIDSCNKFYIMPLELSTELDTVMKTLEILYTQSEVESDSNPESTILDQLEDPRALLPCVSQYSEDGAWYRALITEIEGDNIYVTFVDYGNSEVSSLKNLKPLTPELLKIPPIAMECSFYAIQAIDGREQELTSKLEEYFLDEISLEMEVYKPEEPYKIRLYHNGHDITEVFCDDGLAKEVIPPPETISDLPKDPNMNLTDDVKGFKIVLNEDSEVAIQGRSLDKVKEISVNVKHCEISSEKILLYGVPIEMEDELTVFQESLQTVYNEKLAPLPEVKCLSFCVAKYLEDENWYRAKIVDYKDDEISVQFIDYGNTETVKKNDLKALLPEFTNVPAFSVEFSPSGITVEELEEVQSILDANIYNEPVHLDVCNFSHNKHGICFLSINNSSGDLIEPLLNKNLVSQQFIFNSIFEETFKGTIESVIGSIFYVFPTDWVETRLDLQHRLDVQCVNIKTVEEINVFRLHAAKIDDKWSRVSVISTSDDDALVLCVDFGLNATVKLSELVILPEEFCHEPLLILPSALKDFESMPVNYRDNIVNRIDKGEIFQFALECNLPKDGVFVVKLTNEIETLVSEEVSTLLQNDIVDTHILQNGIPTKDIIVNGVSNGENESVQISRIADTELPSLNQTEKEERREIKNFTGENEYQVNEKGAEVLNDYCNKIQDNSLSEKNVEDYNEWEKHINDDYVKSEAGSNDNELPESLSINDLCKTPAVTNVCDSEENSFDPVLNNTRTEAENKSSEELPESLSVKDYVSEIPAVINVGYSEEVLNENSEIKTEESKSFDDSKIKSEDSVNFEEIKVCEKACVKDEENERLKEFSDIESETFSENENKNDAAENISTSETEVKSSANFLLEPESTCTEAAKHEEIKSENVLSNFSDQNSEKLSNNVSKSDVISLGLAASDSYDEHFQSDSVHENEWDERPECDIKVEDFQVNTAISISSDTSTEILENNHSDSTADVKKMDSDCFQEDLKFNECDIELETAQGVKCESESTSLDFQEPQKGVQETEDIPLNLPSNYQECDKDLNVASDIKDEHSVQQLSVLAKQVCITNQLPEFASDLIHELTDTEVLNEVLISHIAVSEGTLLFPVTPKNLLPKLSQLKKTLHSIYSQDQPFLSNVSVQNLYAVYCDGEWFRGKVLDFKENTATMIFIDTGAYNTIELANIRELKEELKTIPPFAMWCVLASAYCSSHNTAALKLFLDGMLDLAISTKQDITVKVIQGDEPYKVNLFIEGIDLLNMLLSEKQIIQQLTPSLILDGEHFGKISHLKHLDTNGLEFSIILVAQVEELNKLSDSMQAAYCLENFKVSILESGYYAVLHKGFWCRGKAISSGNELSILLVDSGENINVSDVYALLPEHCMLPPFAIPCETKCLDFTMKKDLSEGLNTLRNEEFRICIESASDNKVKAKIIDESFLERLKNSLAQNSTED